MEPLLNEEGYRIMQDSLKSRALFYDYQRRLGYKLYSPCDGKEIDVDALMLKAFPERAKKQ
ncbi:hypothetical protein SAMN05518672_102143 [Chitinophaga sp. CF118]|uniref:hypothetical protein n=1 Tax=Chitinophaga sp. CF118 TaxID=1884367 RepID=UPI0008E3200F|nr:hypothetical protein [Chitinophaga sp. CF118]SFD48681.1 hypothetical protein SAMN05518672_102143 [Chitinophaga sp. CF118]